MAKIKLCHNKKWVKYNKGILKDKKFQEIFEFYILQCPYGNTSLMGIDINSLFKKHKISSNEIKEYLLESIDLTININFVIANNLNEMEDKAKTVELYNNFPNKKDKVRAIIWNKCKGTIMSLLYSIRCGLAHGNFLIKKIHDEEYLILESINTREKCISSRVVINTNKLIELKDRILGGDNKFIEYQKDKDIKIINGAIEKLNMTEVSTKKQLKKIVGIDYEKFNKLCQKHKYKINKNNRRYLINKK